MQAFVFMLMEGEELKPTASYGQGFATDVEFWVALLFGASGCLFLAWWLHSFQGFNFVEEWRRIIWLTLLYPLLEEYLFRGLLQSALLKVETARWSRCGITLANFVTTSVFAAFHLVAHTPLWSALVIIPSLIFGLFRDRYNSVLPAVILHCGYNTAYFLSFGLPG